MGLARKNRKTQNPSVRRVNGDGDFLDFTSRKRKRRTNQIATENPEIKPSKRFESLSVADASGTKKQWRFRLGMHPVLGCIICPSLTRPARKTVVFPARKTVARPARKTVVFLAQKTVAFPA